MVRGFLERCIPVFSRKTWRITTCQIRGGSPYHDRCPSAEILADPEIFGEAAQNSYHINPERYYVNQ